MNIEIIDFFPLEQDEKRETLSGTLRIKLPDIGIHILGIFVTKKKDYWFFSLPNRQAIHSKTGERVRYPCIVFEDREKQIDLTNSIRSEGRVYIEKRLLDIENPLIFPQKLISESKPTRKPPKTNDASKEKKNTIASASPASIAKREYVDLPPRNKKAYQNKKN